MIKNINFNYLLFLILSEDILIDFRERGKEGEKNQMVASPTPPADDLAGNPALCPDWESNRPALNPLSHTRPGYSTVL